MAFLLNESTNDANLFICSVLSVILDYSIELFIMNTNYSHIIKEAANRLPGVKHEFESPV